MERTTSDRTAAADPAVNFVVAIARNIVTVIVVVIASPAIVAITNFVTVVDVSVNFSAIIAAPAAVSHIIVSVTVVVDFIFCRFCYCHCLASS